ncbi:hypothetical protein AB1M95_19180 [Sulfitobacter sp. LCG007]
MLRTITVGKAVSIQGVFVRSLPDGRILVRVDDTLYAGSPVRKAV